MNKIRNFALISLVVAFFGLSAMTWSAEKSLKESAEEQKTPAVTYSQQERDKMDHEWRLTRAKDQFMECLVISSVALVSLVVVLSFIKISHKEAVPGGE